MFWLATNNDDMERGRRCKVYEFYIPIASREDRQVLLMKTGTKEMSYALFMFYITTRSTACRSGLLTHFYILTTT